MTDTKTTGLGALAANPADTDKFMVVDVSDTTMFASGTNKYLDASYIVFATKAQTLTNKTLTTPTIASFANAGHNHQDAAGGGQLDHGAALTGLGDDDHTQYLLATGARTGASSQAQTFTNGIVGPSWKPASNSTTAIAITDVAGTTIFGVDTTNKRASVTGRMTVGGTVDDTVSLSVVPTIANSNTTQQQILQIQGTLTPTGASLADAYAMINLFAINTSSANVTRARAVFGRVQTGSGYSGVVSEVRTFEIANAVVSGGSITTQYGLYIANINSAGTNYAIYTNAGTIRAGGGMTAAAWGVAGIQTQIVAATYTDSSTAASGTATNAVANAFARPTFAASNSSVTMTNAATLYIANAPAAGTNVTLTNAYALWVDDGASRFDGNIGFFATAPASQQASGANLTNNVTSGGTDNTIADYSDLTTYANDAAAIRNNIYQLARKLKQVNDALRVYGLLS